MAAEELEAIDEPERARKKDTFARWKPVDTFLVSEVAQYEVVAHERSLNRVDRLGHALVLRGKKADQWNEQETRLELLRSVRLHERRERRVVAPVADLRVDLVANLAPAIGGTVEPLFLDRAYRPVECDPAHHLRVREVPSWPSDLPDALVRLPPAGLEITEQLPLQRPGLLFLAEAVDPGLVERVEHLAVHIELKLPARGVADPDGARGLVASEPRELELRQAPLACDAVHDLQVRRIPGDRAEEPQSPVARLVDVVAVQKREQRQGRVPEPAIAIVPVAHAADVFGERCRRRGDDAAGRRVGQRLQHDQRAVQLVVPATFERAAIAEVRPELLRVAQRLFGIDLFRRVRVRGEPRKRERDALPFPDRELCDGPKVLTPHVDGCPKAETVRAGDRDARIASVHPLNPGDDRAVVEPDDQFGAHPDGSADAFDDPHDVRRRLARRHEVDHADRAARRLPVGFQNERLVSIPPARRVNRFVGLDHPAAVFLVPEQRCEACGGIETGKAEPVDRAVARDERGRLKVTEKRIVLDPRAHQRFSISSAKRDSRFATARLNASSYSSAASSSSVRAKLSRMSARISVPVSTRSR